MRSVSNLAGFWHRHEATLLAAVSVVVALGSVAGGAAFLKTRAPTDQGSARCYTVVSYGNGRTFTGTTITAGGKPGSAAQVRSALNGCDMLWRQGFLTDGSGMLHPSAAVVQATSSASRCWWPAPWPTAPPPFFGSSALPVGDS